MDVLTVEQRRKNMQAIRSKNTRIEIKLSKGLFSKGYRFRRNDRTVYGRPDISIKKYKLAIFCDSEFWHGKDWESEKERIKSNRDFWYEKIESNIQRDKIVNDYLFKTGWKVLRFWGKEIDKNTDVCISMIENAIKEKRMIKYSELRDRFKIDVDKNSGDGLASLTHYFQNQRTFDPWLYKEPAIKYLRQCELDFEMGLFKDYTPIKWDVPFPPVKKPKFTFIDLFAGIGGIRLAYQNLGGQSVFTSEINNFAKKTYEANFGEVPFGDITKIDENEIPNHDLLLAGFPCQPFSIAGVSKKNSLGKAHGFKDVTQGTLFFDIARILEAKQPNAFMLENVKNLISHDKGKTFTIISKTLDELGYKIFTKVLDGKHYVPQHRERIIIVGFLKKFFGENIKFEFPKPPDHKKAVLEILEEVPEGKYTLSDKLWNYLQEYSKKHKAKGNGFGYGIIDKNGITRTLSARYYKDGSEILIPQPELNPRRLTPRECARLQGFPDNFIIPVSDNQAYKQFGNSVVVPLIQSVGNQVLQTLLTKNKNQ